MTKRFRDAFPKRVPRAARLPEQGEPWMVSDQNARSILAIAAGTGAHPNVILNELVAMSVIEAKVLNQQLAFGGMLIGAQQTPSPASPAAAEKPEDLEEGLSAEENLAKLRDIAEGKAEPSPGRNPQKRFYDALELTRREHGLTIPTTANRQAVVGLDFGGETYHVTAVSFHAEPDCHLHLGCPLYVDEREGVATERTAEGTSEDAGEPA